MLPRAEVDRQAGVVVRAARDRMLRLEHELARSQTPEVVAEVSRAVREALEELANLPGARA